MSRLESTSVSTAVSVTWRFVSRVCFLLVCVVLVVVGGGGFLVL